MPRPSLLLMTQPLHWNKWRSKHNKVQSSQTKRTRKQTHKQTNNNLNCSLVFLLLINSNFHCSSSKYIYLLVSYTLLNYYFLTFFFQHGEPHSEVPWWVSVLGYLQFMWSHWNIKTLLVLQQFSFFNWINV